MSVHVLGDEDTVLGFRLAGIRGTVAEPGEGLAEQFRALVTDERSKVVLITERLAVGIRPLVIMRVRVLKIKNGCLTSCNSGPPKPA